MIQSNNNTEFWSNWTDEPVAVIENRVISRSDFLQQAISLSEQLPYHQYAINLCKDRYHFAVGFLAVLLKKQTSILPPNNSVKSIKDLIDDYADSYILSDENNIRNYRRYYRVSLLQSGPDVSSRQTPSKTTSIKSDHLVAIVFTSGSTGKALANYKYWGQIVEGTGLSLDRFQISRQQPQALISTVPAQHMYGFETSILFPLLGNSVLISGKTFFPYDIREILEHTVFPSILITTPVHLRVCLQANLTWPSVDFIISATAPLDKNLAIQVEENFNCPVMEIFGSTETGAIASRRTVQNKSWFLYEGMQMKQDQQGNASVKGPQHKEWVSLSDHVNVFDEHHFELLGRHTDMVKIAGKRASIADLMIKLNSVEGVVDGVIFQPDNVRSGVNRLIAFVIAPGLTVRQINKAMVEMVDPVFLPRPVIKVDQLPRNETGKLSYSHLMELYSEYSNHA